MIAQVLIVPLCVTKDIYCFGSTTVLGERSQGAPSAREVTTKKRKKKTCHAVSSASQQSCRKLGVKSNEKPQCYCFLIGTLTRQVC